MRYRDFVSVIVRDHLTQKYHIELSHPHVEQIWRSLTSVKFSRTVCYGQNLVLLLIIFTLDDNKLG